MAWTGNMTASSLNISFKPYLAYFGMILVLGATTAGIYLVGDGQFPKPNELNTANAEGAASQLLFHLLLALVVVIAVAKLAGKLFRFLKQPAVMGEVVAGIALGPSLLGAFSPDLLNFVMPPILAPTLGLISQLGIVIFMFLVGVELDTALLRQRGRASVAISHASILTPLFLGAVMALWLYPRFSFGNISFSVFAIFLGVSLSITAFPVLARILSDFNISQTPLGALTITCAAVGDVTAWCLLALAVGIAQANLMAVAQTLVWSAVFFVVMLRLAPPLVGRFADKIALAQNDHLAMTLVVLCILLTALCTEAIGIHALFGPFLLGALIPKNSALADKVQSKLEPLTSALLLPIFFAFTGLRTQIALVNTKEQWLWCLAIIIVASVAKIAGASIAARMSGVHWRDSLGIGVLMNTRGLMELIVLNVGLEMGVLSPTLFTMMVIMAIVTTLMTGPLFAMVTKKQPWGIYAVTSAQAN